MACWVIKESSTNRVKRSRWLLTASLIRRCLRPSSHRGAVKCVVRICGKLHDDHCLLMRGILGSLPATCNQHLRESHQCHWNVCWRICIFFAGSCTLCKWWKTVPLSTSLGVLAKHARPPNPVTVTTTPTLTLSPYPLLPFWSALSRFMAPWWVKVCVCAHVCVGPVGSVWASRYGYEWPHVYSHLSVCPRGGIRFIRNTRGYQNVWTCKSGSVCMCMCANVIGCVQMVSGLCNSPRRRIVVLQPPCSFSWGHRATGSRRSF